MGEGLYWSRDGRTAYVEPFDDLDPDDHLLWQDAWSDLDRGHRVLPVGRVGARAAALEAHRRADRLAATACTKSGSSRTAMPASMSPSACAGDLCDTEALARATMPDRAEAFFDRLALHYDLRVRTSAWTSAARVARPNGEAVA